MAPSPVPRRTALCRPDGSAVLDAAREVGVRGVYLVGDAFTVPDLTAAALLGPLVRPPELEYPPRVEMPPYLEEYRGTLLGHPATQWAAGIYRLHRGRSAEVPRRSATA